MPNCDFYVVGDDTRSVLDFVFSQRGWALYELSSRPDSPLRKFDSTEAVTAVFDLPNTDVRFHLCAQEMGGRVREKRIVFKPGAVPGASFRFDSQGWGLVQLYFVAPRDGKLKASHTNHNSELRARRWEPTYADEPDRVDDWDWKAVERTSARLNRFIRGVALSKVGSRPVLPMAHRAHAQGSLQLML